MARKKENIGKSYDELAYQELDREALVEHALTLEEAEEALDYLEEIGNETTEYTEEMKEIEREKLRSKTKRKKDKETGNFIYSDEPLYTSKEIEERLKGKKRVPKYTLFEVRRLYCEKYWPDKITTKGAAKEPSLNELIAEARAKLKKGKRK